MFAEYNHLLYIIESSNHFFKTNVFIKMTLEQLQWLAQVKFPMQCEKVTADEKRIGKLILNEGYQGIGTKTEKKEGLYTHPHRGATHLIYGREGQSVDSKVSWSQEMVVCMDVVFARLG